MLKAIQSPLADGRDVETDSCHLFRSTGTSRLISSLYRRYFTTTTSWRVRKDSSMNIPAVALFAADAATNRARYFAQAYKLNEQGKLLPVSPNRDRSPGGWGSAG